MTITNATLTINSKQYDIFSFSYKFQRDIDAKGRPRGVYYGGEILVQMESTDDSELFRQTVDKKTTPVSGSIETFSGDGTCVRRIDFEKAYLCALGKEMQNNSSLPMTTTLSISPMRLDFNNTLRLDRRWPEAPHGWQKYEAKEEKYASSGADNKPMMQIAKAYWLDKKGRKHTELYTKRPVTLYVVIDNYIQGETVDFHFEDSDRDGWSAIGYSGVVDKDGIVEIKNFQLKPKNKR